MDHYWSLIFITGFLAVVFASPLGETEERIFNGYIHCKNNDNCPENHCCMLGMQRYSVPTCSPYGIQYDPCIPANPQPRNFTLSYPNTRDAVEVDAYLLYCPCKAALACDRDTNSCKDPLDIKSTPIISLDKTNNI